MADKKKTEEKKEAPDKKVAKNPEAKPVEKPVKKDVKAEKPEAKVKKDAKEVKDAADRVYHISYRKDTRKWQVKAVGDTKALKLFWTQAEAIEYAKSVAGNQEGRIVIHKEDGSFRKLNY